MFYKALYSERMKLRHSPVWLAFLILPVIPAVMGTFNYYQNISILQDQWYSLWSQQTLFSCFLFLPALIGVYCSYLYRLEHMNQNWHTIITSPVPIRHFSLAKLFSASAMVVLTQIWTGILFIISGRIVGFEGPIPHELLRWLYYGTFGGITISALQLSISLVIRSFAVPVGIALIGGISGLVTLAKGYGAWNPYSLLSLGMQANRAGEAMQFSQAQFFLTCFLVIIISLLFSNLWIGKHDM